MDTLFAICATYQVDDGQAAGFMLMRKEPDGGAKPWPILITRIGPCQGQALTPIKLIIDDGDVCLSGIDLAEEDGLDIPEPDEVPEVQITAD